MACGTYRKGVLGESTNLVPPRAFLACWNPKPSASCWPGERLASGEGRPQALCQGPKPPNQRTKQGVRCAPWHRVSDQEERGKELSVPERPLLVTSLLRDSAHLPQTEELCLNPVFPLYNPEPKLSDPSPRWREEKSFSTLLPFLRKHSAPSECK